VGREAKVQVSSGSFSYLVVMGAVSVVSGANGATTTTRTGYHAEQTAINLPEIRFKS
jgi:hypothetical protein